MNRRRHWATPTATDLVVDPERAALALLEAALTVASSALCATNPELDARAETWATVPPVAVAAREIVVHAKHLLHLIDDYRRLLERPPFDAIDDLF